jgi:hypothetical protein
MALITLVSAGGCGRKGDPYPPLRPIPISVQDLEVEQRGELLQFRMTYPQTTTGGFALPGIEAVELWEVAMEGLSEESAPPQLGAAEFESLAELRLTLTDAELSSAMEGAHVVFRVPEAPRDPPRYLLFTVRSRSTAGFTSGHSNTAAIQVVAPPDPPSLTGITPGADGIRIEWDAGDQTYEAFHVYRRGAREKSYGEPLDQPGADERSYEDKTAQLGQRYIYGVTGLSSTDPVVESGLVMEKEVDYEDRYPPPAPTGLVALAETGEVRLIWKASSATDVQGYYVYRKDPGLAFRQLNEEPITALEYRDTGLVSGLTYRYRVTAVDEDENEGEPCREKSATLP